MLAFVCGATSSWSGTGEAQSLAEWAVEPGFALKVDVAHLDLATSIAMVPNPGPGPKDPLYFVTELQGRVKVVTNDRSVHVFAENFLHLDPLPQRAPEKHLMELGMAGICLAPEQGYVFVSFTYTDKHGAIRNNVVRFQSTPGVFSLKAQSSIAFTGVFEDQIGDFSHMIGPLVVHDDALFVHVGDAHAPHLARDLSSSAGKILRMSLDGKPLPSNPYYVDGDVKNIRNFIWAKGLRNPFGVQIVNAGYFVTDVGPSVDRFLRVEQGGDYGYDGTDWSISSHAKVVFAPSVAPVQLIYHPAEAHALPPQMRDAFYLVTSGDQLDVGAKTMGKRALLRIKYDFAADEVIDRPFEVVKYVGDGHMQPVGLGLGRDALYIVVFNSRPGRESYVMRLRYDPKHQHSQLISRVDRLMNTLGCAGCHREGEAGPAPSLAQEALTPRILARLNSTEYAERSEGLDKRDDAPFVQFRGARKTVREASGRDKVRLWIKYRLLEPRFDMPDAMMPRLPMAEADAEAIARFLVPPEPGMIDRIKLKLAEFIPQPRQRHLFAFFGVGVVFGISVVGGMALMLRLLRRRRRSR